MTFADGFKFNGTVGGGIYLKPLEINMSLRLPDFCSVFPAEVLAIWAAVVSIRDMQITTVTLVLLSDRQATNRPLSSVVLNSGIVYDDSMFLFYS